MSGLLPMVKRRLVVLLLVLLTAGGLPTRVYGEDSSAAMAAQIEGRQSSNRRDVDSFTLQEIMRASPQRIGGIH
jgi:hypothetical protein